MLCKLECRVDATPAVRLSLAALFAHPWNGTTGVSTSLKPPMVEGGTDNDGLLGNPGNGIGPELPPEHGMRGNHA